MKKITIYILMGAFLIVQSACKKDLNALPQNSKVDAITIVDEGTAQIALNGVYYCFANASNVKTGWQMHEVAPGMWSGYLGYGYGGSSDEDNINESSSYSAGIWNEAYLTINAANGVLKGINGLADNKFTGTKKNEMLGETRFLRGYANFRLLIHFAEWFKSGSALGVLLRDELSSLGNIAKARSTVQESYAFILADLDFAIANAPAQNPTLYATKWAAMALKMRVLMARGGTGDYASVITLADAIIQGNQYVLEPNLKDIFYTKGLTSKEVILGIKPQVNQEADYYSKSHQYWPGASSLYIAKKALFDLLQGDPRASWMIGTANPGTAGTYFFTKHIAQNSPATQITEVSFAFRLSEVYLLKSEAILRSGGALADARTILKNIMAHAGVTNFAAVDNATTADALLLQNYYEVVKNLVGEDGAEWTALLRFPLGTVTQLKSTIKNQVQYIFPIPHSEFLYNPAIGEQNPGYSK